MCTGNKEFLVTINAKHAFCQPGPNAKAAILKSVPGMTSEKLAKDPDYKNISQRHFTALGNGQWPSLMKPIWGDLIMAVEDTFGDKDSLVVKASAKTSYASILSHFHICWDFPDSNFRSRFVHDGNTLIYIINGHCVDCHLSTIGEVAAAVRFVCSLPGPSIPPLELSGDCTSYRGAPHRPSPALDLEPDEFSHLAQKLAANLPFATSTTTISSTVSSTLLSSSSTLPSSSSSSTATTTTSFSQPLHTVQCAYYEHASLPPAPSPTLPTISSPPPPHLSDEEISGCVPSASGRPPTNQYGGKKVMLTMSRATPLKPTSK